MCPSILLPSLLKEKTQMDYLKELNEPQHGAVTTIEGPVMVIAGPGSGKTRVLTFRIAYLIESGVAPWNILALTFTNKAAKEMKGRIAKVVGDKANSVWAGTFHSIFARILRSEATKIGYPSDFTIYDTDDSKSVIKEIVKTMGLDPKVYKPGPIKNRISSAKSNLITYKAYAKNLELIEKDKFSKLPMMFKIYERYVRRLEKSGAMDFDDLLLMMFRLLYQNPENVLEKYRKKFTHLLVDEFQDTNTLQYAILKLLVKYPNSKENICIVGDDAQSIYAFRGATITNILNFKKEFKNLKTFKLEQNYRSTNHIVEAANDVINWNKNQIDKKIWTEKDGGNKIKVIRALSDTEEGRKIVDLILEQKNRNHLANKEIAILYRTNAQSRVFEEYLRRKNVNYKIFGGLSFYQRKEVKDLLAYLRLAVNPNDGEAFKRAVNFPKRGIGKTTIDKLAQHAAVNDISIWESLGQVPLSTRATGLLNDFKRLVANFANYSADHTAYQSVIHIYKKSGLHKLLQSDTSIEGVNRMENINALLDGVQEFTEADEVSEEFSEDKSLSAYLQNIALLTDFDSSEDDTNYVTLMSVHAAKGLEYKSIFVVGLEENLFPSFMSKDSAAAIDEERRLFYVAITRAEEFLTLSYANSRYQYGQMRANEVSRFLGEIGSQHIDSTFELPSQKEAFVGASRSGVQGSFTRPANNMNLPKVDMANFRPSPSSQIEVGKTVRHLKFGDGKVVSVDGANNSRVATIMFENIDNPKRRIMLKFAKIMVLEE